MGEVESLDAKLIQLQFTRDRTEDIIKSGKLDRVERQINALKELSGEADGLRIALEGIKIAAKEKVEDIKVWSDDVEARITGADDDVSRLRNYVEEVKKMDNQKLRDEELYNERKLHETRLQFQTELEAKKLQQAQEIKSAPGTTESSGAAMQAKLPKLVISKFNGSFQDWQRFWGQFCEAIDKSSIAGVTKLSYLRELLVPKVRASIEALPFSSEGYNRAKSILKDRYGKESEVVKAYNKEILELPFISGGNVKRIHEFSERLTYCVQSLETMGKLDQVNGNASMILDKLPGIRGDLVRTDDLWESWGFVKLAEALQLWTRRNPIEFSPSEKSDPFTRRREKADKLFNARQQDPIQRGCVYCDDATHRSGECPKITTLDERKRFLARHRLCFNCTRSGHLASKCESKSSCRGCHRRHHTSICDGRTASQQEVALTASKKGDGIFPVVNVKVNGIECRALIDTGAGSSYLSAKLTTLLKIKPTDVQVKQVDMLMSTSLARLETYQACVESVCGKFKMQANLIKVDKGELLEIDNPHYDVVIAKYPHLEGVEMRDRDTKPQLPVHIILGAGEYARIKTETRPRIGNDGEPVAELTKMGWFVMSPGQEFDRHSMMLTQTSQLEYEELCKLDVLGLADTPLHDQQAVYGEFKEQLARSEEGWYETGLPWKGDRSTLPNNEKGSLQRLRTLTSKLQRTGQTQNYDAIIREQKEQGIVEVADQAAKGVEFYIPHKPVIRENAESTKLRIVYDASARAHPSAPSLNECLNAGPPLQNKLWDVLVRQRSYPVAVTGDLQKAFLQVRIKEAERDALRFHWRTDGNKELETFRFTRALFGLTSSPFLLGGVLECHLQTWEARQPEIVAEIRKNLYVDDLLSGGATTQEAHHRKESAIEIFEDAQFKLHKWHSNIPSLEQNADNGESDLTFAKQQLQSPPSSSASLLGLGWDKVKDELSVKFPTEKVSLTKRGVLSKLSKVYDPLGLVSPVTLEGKIIFRDVCEKKEAWDAELAEPLSRKWKKWEQSLPLEQLVPRPIASYQEPLQDIELHSFGDASKQGVGAAVYAVVRQQSGTTQRLVAAKARLAKRGLSIPRLELVAGHMATNLVTNVKNALEGLPISNEYCWLDSTVALHWIQGRGEYKQFVQNRVMKIQAKADIVWRHVSSQENPADLASRGGVVSGSNLWWNGPRWLANKKEWPANPVISSSPESEAEAKTIREVLAVAQTKAASDELDEVLDKHDLRRALRVAAWVTRFITNYTSPRKLSGPLTTAEIESVKRKWIQRVQQQALTRADYPQIRSSLNLQLNEEGLLECRGRIQGKYPIFLPEEAIFTEKLVRRMHCETLHGGVGLTMAAVRENYWVPRLRRLIKKVTKKCWGCKRFQATAIAAPPPGLLPTNRTEGTTAFEVAGVDFAGPIRYRRGANREGKAYIALFACSLTRAVYLEVLPSLETGKFLPCLKRFIARRGRPKTMYSDNGRTFVKAAKWLKSLRRDERMQGYLEEYEMQWHFNLPRAPWWGGQFERLIGIMKQALNKTIGAATLTWDELSEVMLDVETQINRRPLSYVEDDVQLPTLTPSVFLFQRSNQLPEQEPWREEDVDLRRRAKYLKSCKEQLWRRWTREYLTALRERHNLNHKRKNLEVLVGDVVLIKSDEKNRSKWPMGVVSEVYPGRDGIVRAVQVDTGKRQLERSIQHLYPMELSCDKPTTPVLNPEASAFRPRRQAAVLASDHITAIALHEQDS